MTCAPGTRFGPYEVTSIYDVSTDGKQFVMVRTARPNTRTLSVRVNWKTELDRLVPIQR